MADEKSAMSDGPVFQRVDWLAALGTFSVTLATYVATLAPTVTLEDSGELATASTFLGVPHPPGYPSWTFITWLFTKLFSGASYLGHPNPAWAVALASAFFGALTCGVLALLISRSGADLLQALKPNIVNTDAPVPTGGRQQLWRFLGGLGGGLLLAFSPVLWSQSTIVEVYALNGFFQTTILALLYRWLRRPAQSWALFLLCFLFGFGVTNHQTLLFLGPALAVAVLVCDVKLFRDFLIVGVALLLVVGFNIWLAQHAQSLAHLAASATASGQDAWAAGLQAKRLWYEQAQWLAGPLSTASPGRNAVVAMIFHLTGANINPAFWIYMLLAVTIPLAGLWLPHGRKVCIAFLLIELGLLFYLFMPFASAHNPPINWSYPRMWEGFINALTRGQYSAVVFADIFSMRFLAQVGRYLSDLRNQFTLPVVLAGLLPFCMWSIQLGGRRWRAFTVALLLGLAALPLSLLDTWLEWAPLMSVCRALAAAILLLALTGCSLMLYRFVRDWLADLQRPDTDLLTRVVGLLLLVLLALAVVGCDCVLLAKASRNLMAGLLGRAALGLVLIAAPPVLALVFHRLARAPHALCYDLTVQTQRWLLATVVAFLGVSVLFITFQNLELDIQNQFVGRVQFVQSHSTFALWLGGGLLLALAGVERLFAGRRGAVLAGVALVAFAPLTLIYQNYFDAQQVRVIGGAEQNGHDFGWQFGCGALEGMAGLRPTLQPGDPPPPDFAWPPPMATNAIYFGGTDPGRFVPTYMVFCARVRPDVFVLTQNALIDNFYLAPMRDLYGARIWLPSEQDAEFALNRYIADVEQGRIPNRGEVFFEGGMARLMGRQGTMAVNGAVARMIFEANKARHAFYVEESDVISWMYPYLTPHGLIMKLNPEPLAELPPDLVRHDRTFWDWQTRRLLGNEHEVPHGWLARLFPRQAVELRGHWQYRHDTVAQRLFSKLRCAIGGLYAHRKMNAEAEYAYRQAIQLYPVGPEAYLRLADLYAYGDRFAEARHVVEALLQLDPDLAGARNYLGFIEALRHAKARRAVLESTAANGPLPLTNALELAEIYDRLGEATNFVQSIHRLLNATNQAPDAALTVAEFLAGHKHPELLPLAFQTHLRRHPEDLGIRVEFAAFSLFQHQTNAAREQLQMAFRTDAAKTRELVLSDPRYSALRKLSEFQQAPSAQPAAPLLLKLR